MEGRLGEREINIKKERKEKGIDKIKRGKNEGKTERKRRGRKCRKYGRM
jgi:hypothetical protein